MNPVQNRTFIGAIAHSIKAFCLLFVNIVSVADDAVAMADKAVKHARKKQAIDLASTTLDYATRIANETALRRAKEQLLVQEFRSISGNAEIFDIALADVKAAIKAELATIGVVDPNDKQ